MLYREAVEVHIEELGFPEEIIESDTLIARFEVFPHGKSARAVNLNCKFPIHPRAPFAFTSRNHHRLQLPCVLVAIPEISGVFEILFQVKCCSLATIIH